MGENCTGFGKKTINQTLIVCSEPIDVCVIESKSTYFSICCSIGSIV